MNQKRLIEILDYDTLDRLDLPRSAAPRVRPLSEITHIVPHHTGDNINDPYRHAKYHLSKGWAALGYNIYWYQGRPIVSRELFEIGAHAKGFNYPSVGVVQTGNFNKENLTDEHYLKWIIMILCVEKYLGRELKIKLHCQVSPTTCPGRNFDLEYFMTELNEMRYVFR